ncbi:MAG TPA: DUF2808 domain-containing protein [Coleofasciculaceae cyanobacterium]|jgi:hypothetical protein
MRFISRSIALITVSLAIGTLSPLLIQRGQAVELRGQVYFDHPPTLVNAVTTRRTASSSGATYYFTLAVPEDAGEPLQRVSITQQDGSSFAQLVRYNTDKTRAFLGTPRNRSGEVTLGETTFDADSQTVSVEFDPPVLAGKTVTVGLRPVRNPQRDGIYLFGVTAYPAGEDAYGQFLGYGRLDFDRSDRDFMLP